MVYPCDLGVLVIVSSSHVHGISPSGVWKLHPSGRPTPISALGTRRLTTPKSVAKGNGGGSATRVEGLDNLDLAVGGAGR